MEEENKTTALDTFKKGAENSVRIVKNNPVPLLYVAGAAVGVFLLYKIFKGVSGAVDLSTDPNAGGNASDIDAPAYVPKGGTITNAQATTAAAVLMDAMHTWGQVNRSEFERIKEVFKGRNAVDFGTISKAFGQPRRSIFTGEGSVLLLGGEKLGLSQWIASEVRPEWVNELRGVIPNVF